MSNFPSCCFNCTHHKFKAKLLPNGDFTMPIVCELELVDNAHCKEFKDKWEGKT